MSGEDTRSPPAASEAAAPPTLRDVERFRILAARAPMESALRGSSMGAALADGTRIRIAWPGPTGWRPGQVLAFLGGTRVMVHRLAYVARSEAARGYLITQGDGNWFCDPPVQSAAVAGLVDEYLVDGAWRPVPPARMSAARRATLGASVRVLGALLERSPTAALRVARVFSYGRNTVRGLWMRAMRREP